MASIKLSDRLLAIAQLVPTSGGVADVGTDHGYIPVWLAQNGHQGRLFATDIKKAPLGHAKQTAVEYGQKDKIDFHLCDGLSALNGEDISTVIIAGMGGENIAEILSAAHWTKENEALIILQPMSKASFLRKWLFENGYKVLSEQLIDDGAVYEILTVQPGEDKPYSPAELLTGHNNLISSNPLFEKQLKHLIKKSERTVFGLSSSAKAEDHERLAAAIETLSSLLEMKNGNLPIESKGGSDVKD